MNEKKNSASGLPSDLSSFVTYLRKGGGFSQKGKITVQSIYPKTQQQSLSKDLTELKLACKHKYWNRNPVPIQAVLRTRLNTSTTRSDSLAPQLQAVYLTLDFSCVGGCVRLGKKRDLEFSSVLLNSGVGRMNGGIGVL